MSRIAIVIGISFLVFLAVLFKALLHQSKEPTGKLGAWLMKLWNIVYLPMVKWSIAFVPQKSELTILDVGIGNGASTKILAQSFNNSTIFGIDFSTKAIQQAKQLNPDPTITYQEMTVEELKFEANYFDLIFAFQTHFHWTNLGKALSELKRTLKKEGMVVLACESAKVAYYLPNLVAPKSFTTYLESFDLTIYQVEKQKGWIFYKIGAKK